MKNTISLLMIFSALAMTNAGCGPGSGEENSCFLGKRNIKIVVTDSGLGGISVMEDIARRMTGSNYYRRVELIFVNALFDAESGYNALPTREEKISKFNDVLYGIENKFRPDAIVVACNTLSVLIDDTDYPGKSKTPVIGIIEPGIDLIMNEMRGDPSASVIIMGTETTIEEDSHRSGLLARGISADRIITQACPQLQAYIEADPLGEEAEMLINYYVLEALGRVNQNTGKLFLSLNCSHFGYSGKLWNEALESGGYTPGGILNPNIRMADMLFCNERGSGETKMKYSVVSKVRIDNVEPIQNLIKINSPDIANALSNYSLIQDLF